MYLSAAILGVTLGTYTSMGQDLLTLVRLEDWIAFALLTLWQDPRQKTGRICSTDAILKMELETSAVFVCERTGYAIANYTSGFRLYFCQLIKKKTISKIFNK